jgi:hypothetical protein
MSNTPDNIRELSNILISNLKSRNKKHVSIDIIYKLFMTMFNASLMCEESKAIRFNIAYIDPMKPDPNPPINIRRDRWKYFPIAKPIPFDIEQVVKLAHASDPRSSLLVIYPDKQGIIKIWGFIDQQNSFDDFSRFDADSYFSPPGLFHAGVLGVGRIVVSIESVKIAELYVDKITHFDLNVIRKGPINKLLMKGIRNYFREIRTKIPNNLIRLVNEYKSSFERDWYASICRILLRVKGFCHGGAILITPDENYKGLNLKYKIEYPRLKEALSFRGVTLVSLFNAQSKINEFTEDYNEMPVDLYLDESISSFEIDDCDSELDGAIWFISLLSRVDGLVLMNPSLEVKGFGVEITVDKPPSKVVKALNEEGTKTCIVDYNHFGTRHRSMMRYCNHIPGSIGFVISQDGHVRAISKQKREVVIWNSVKIDAIISQNRCKK